VEIPAVLPPIRGDARLLTQMVNNVLSNAIEAMPRGGALHVVASRAAALP